MPDLIQFDCPACTTTLRVPLEMAAQQGPCPVCIREIVSPDPFIGEGAYLAGPPAVALPLPQPTSEAASKSPFAKTRATVSRDFDSTPPSQKAALPQYRKIEKIELPSEPEDPAQPVVPPRQRKKSAPFAILATCAGIALLTLAVGIFIGNHYRIFPAAITRPARLPAPAPTPPPEPQEVAAVPPGPPPENPLEPATPEKPKLVIEGAEATLRAFLQAPDWATRSAYVLSPETVRSKMESYSKTNPDGATKFDSFAVKHSQVDELSGSTLLIFEVISPDAPGGIPVAILETSGGWLVDWESFVEFRDEHFKHFAEGPAEFTGEFHLIVTKPPLTLKPTQENENFASYQVAPPLPDRQRTAFVKKSNPAFEQLHAATADDPIFAPVLEVTKIALPDGRTYLEIVSIIATDWRPRPPLANQ